MKYRLLAVAAMTMIPVSMVAIPISGILWVITGKYSPQWFMDKHIEYEEKAKVL